MAQLAEGDAATGHPTRTIRSVPWCEPGFPLDQHVSTAGDLGLFDRLGEIVPVYFDSPYYVYPDWLGYISLSLPAPVSWLTVYRGFRPDRVGIFLSCHRNTAGAYARQAIIDEWKAGGAVEDELGGTVRLDKTTLGSVDTIIDSLQVESLEQREERKKAFSWLAERVNTCVNVLRPRIRSLAADYHSQGE